MATDNGSSGKNLKGGRGEGMRAWTFEDVHTLINRVSYIKTWTVGRNPIVLLLIITIGPVHHTVNGFPKQKTKDASFIISSVCSI